MYGIYLHIPFCKKKCNYCNFHFSTRLDFKTDLIHALNKELVLRKDELAGIPATLYLGGGTPSLLTEKELVSIFNTLKTHYDLSKIQEVTLEANPDDLTLDYLRFLKTYTPVNRLSIGIQSFFEDDLRLMNRAHNAVQAENSIINAQNAGFHNLSIDLIYGGQTTSDKKWVSNLEKAISLNIPHISSYALTVEPKTAFESQIRKGLLPEIDENKQTKHFKLLCSILKQNQYIQYEFSNFGKESFFAIHNTSYWENKSYLGIGPSAHSFNGKNTRSWNISNNIKYIKALDVGTLPSEKEIITEKDSFNEKIMLGLRTIWGVKPQEIENYFSEVITQHFYKELEVMIKEKKILLKNNTITINPKYLFQTDGIISKFFFID